MARTVYGKIYNDDYDTLVQEIKARYIFNSKRSMVYWHRSQELMQNGDYKQSDVCYQMHSRYEAAAQEMHWLIVKLGEELPEVRVTFNIR